MSKAIVVEEGALVGEIRSEGTISGSIVSEGTLIGSLSMPIGYEDYAGPYKVTPKVESQALSTADKHMAHDVTIEPIPYYEVSNQNGKTIIIGGN